MNVDVPESINSTVCITWHCRESSFPFLTFSSELLFICSSKGKMKARN